MARTPTRRSPIRRSEVASPVPAETLEQKQRRKEIQNEKRRMAAQRAAGERSRRNAKAKDGIIDKNKGIQEESRGIFSPNNTLARKKNKTTVTNGLQHKTVSNNPEECKKTPEQKSQNEPLASNPEFFTLKTGVMEEFEPKAFSSVPKQNNSGDLVKVIIGDGGSATDESNSSGCIHYMNRQILLYHFKKLEPMIAPYSGTEESAQYQVKLLDLDEITWKRMWSAINPKNFRETTLLDAMVLAKWYDRYGFRAGQDLCECILCDYFDGLGNQERGGDLDVDTLVDAVLASFAFNLPDAYEKGSTYVKMKLSTVNVFPYGSSMFSVKHISQLVDVIVDLMEKDCGFKVMGKLGKEVVKSNLFPHMFVMTCQLEDLHKNNKDSIRLTYQGFSNQVTFGSSNWYHMNGRTLCDLKPDASGWVFYAGDVVMVGKRYQLQIKQNGAPGSGKSNWKIIGRDCQGAAQERVLWECPYSSNMARPPTSGWKSVDNFIACFTPKVEYIAGNR